MIASEGFFAHSRELPDGSRRFHALEAHLAKVSVLAAKFAARLNTEGTLRENASAFCALAGIWHDLGKYRPGFQGYIRQVGGSDAHIERRHSGSAKTHSAAGALWAARHLTERMGTHGDLTARVLQYLIAGHHAGLDNWFEGLAVRLSGSDEQLELEEALAAIPPALISVPELSLPDLALVPARRDDPIGGAFALWVRMLFSCLVDADFLDTESFMDDKKSTARGATAPMDDLLASLNGHLAAMQASARGPVNSIRASVLAHCRDAARHSPGAFSLTVPTGGGKTLSSLAFALEHAVLHRKARVIYAIPYTSIIEQTANVFRRIVGDEHLVEHHSNAESDPEDETSLSRLASENWDAPLIVTTNVQLFESLFARRTSLCRKLHNIAGSVIVLDEAQLLPIEFLQPVMDVLRLLIRDYGVTVLFCTATQPVLTSASGFDPRKGLRGFSAGEVTEVIGDVRALYAALHRVEVHMPADLNLCRDWPDVADQILLHEAVLVIVNRRDDARNLHALLRAQSPDGLWHLSALMCAEHRSDVIEEIKLALIARRQAITQGRSALPVRVVSTQLIEAGVDIDFPVVFRAFAGLDSIAQAAGRCNREGLLDKGHVHVFIPPSATPRGMLALSRAACARTLEGHPGNPIDPELFTRYFRYLFADAPLDKHDICSMLRVGKHFDVRFKDASDVFKLIDDQESSTVIVRYPIAASAHVDIHVSILERDGPKRWLMRQLQRYGVTVYRHDIARLQARGDIREVRGCPGLYMQVNGIFYDGVVGAIVDGAPGDPRALVP